MLIKVYGSSKSIMDDSRMINKTISISLYLPFQSRYVKYILKCMQYLKDNIIKYSSIEYVSV